MKLLSSTFLVFLFSSTTTAFNTPFSKKSVEVKSNVAEKKPAFSFGKKEEPTKQVETLKSKFLDIEVPKFGGFKIPKVDTPNVNVPSPVGIAGTAMQTLAPLFALEAKIQAGVLTNVVDIIGEPLRVYPEEIRKDISLRVNSKKKPIMYTYGLSPFSVEAKSILEEYDVEVVELGAEWFLLGPQGSETRLALAENSPNKQTSLPHLFFKGESLGGLSSGGRDNTGILGLQKSGELAKTLPRKK